MNIGVHDPFELIRRQSDPRKGVAELVQNALDEQAAHITIERYRDAGETVLSLLDDGLGVLPELSRKDALTTIATNIGHSRKRQMSFDERIGQLRSRFDRRVERHVLTLRVRVSEGKTLVNPSPSRLSCALAMLLSKEVVTRNSPQPSVGVVLEELVAYSPRSSGPEPARRRGKPRDFDDPGQSPTMWRLASGGAVIR